MRSRVRPPFEVQKTSIQDLSSWNVYISLVVTPGYYMSTANILTKHIAILVKKHAIHIVPNIEETRMVSGTL